MNLAARYLAPAPALRPAVLRILVGGFAVAALLVELPEYLRLADREPSRFAPVGPLWLLESPVDPALARLALGATIALGVAFVAGWRFRITGPLFGIAFLLATTYRNSWEQIFHTENLVALHVLVLAFTRSADVWSLDSRARRIRGTPPETGYGWPPRLMALILVATYFVAGVSKLRIAGWSWLNGDSLANQVAFDNLRKILVGDISSPLASTALDHMWIFTPFALFALGVELGSPLTLIGGRVGRRVRAAWAMSAWLFHVGVLALMAIVFAYPLSGIAFACLFRVERGALAATARLRRGFSPRRQSTVAPARSPT